IMGVPSNGHSILEFTYSVGLCVGIIVFFNHIGGKRISKDPTPLEVSMKRYEEDVNQTLIEEADRMNIEVDTKG
ncbi:MAG: stage V sporulation protein AA, partial [Lachnospiraceae bacterium]|nr:stage V sporulation protein AA [Lachnospiraceae bacterium]